MRLTDYGNRRTHHAESDAVAGLDAMVVLDQGCSSPHGRMGMQSIYQ